MAWSLIPQGRPAPIPSPVRLQISRSGPNDKKLLGVLISPEVMNAADMKPRDFVTLHLGQGMDHGWLRLDLTEQTPDSRVLARLAGSPSASVKFTLNEPTLDPTSSTRALTWEARPGSLFISVPPPLMGLFVAFRAPTVAASGMVPLYSCAKAEPQEDLAPPPAGPEESAAQTPAPTPEQNLVPPAEVAAVDQQSEIPPASPEPETAAPEAVLTAAPRKPDAKTSPDQLKPEAIQMFAAGQRGRAVADALHLSFALVSRWQEEFDVKSGKAPAKRRAA